MKICSLTLIVTDDCNFNCRYCYKNKGKSTWLILQPINPSFSFSQVNQNLLPQFFAGEKGDKRILSDNISLAIDFIS